MSFLDKIGEKIFDCVFAELGRRLGYLIRYKSNVDNLKTQAAELQLARARVICDVHRAKDNVEKNYDDVQQWLIDSNEVMIEADGILQDNERANLNGCNGRCPNLKYRYQVSKRSHKKGLEVKGIKDKGKFDGVGYREPAEVGRTAISNREYELFESRWLILTGVMKALQNPNITGIGVYGMGGIGKTMLVKEVLKRAVKDKLFNKYLFVVVSNAPDLEKIQREIAEKLEMKLDVESPNVLADRLCERLLDENILLVMDDIWNPIDLKALGISFGDDNQRCKLLLTSRFLNVCNGMDTQKQFNVGVISDDDARYMFEKIVGEFAQTHKIKPYMHQIVKECAGLPIAITTVANALKNKTNINVWKDFLKQLKMSSPIEIDGMDEKVYRRIRLSYKFLESEKAESLLLLCSLHEEDYNIKVEDLVRYGVGWGLFDNLDTIEDARCRVDTLVERLKDSSLLLDGEDNGTVKMHDVIRDVVINIAAEERHMFTIRTVKELQTRLTKCKDTVAISLPSYINDDLDLPNQFECSKLELLLLFRQKVGFIPDSFFEGLKDLKVLQLSVSRKGVLPSSLSSLENLQTLCLDGGMVENAIIIGELKNLKALSLSLSNTVQLPKEIGQLTHLQLLDLRECSELRFIPPNVLFNLKRLEELYLPDKVEWEERVTAMVSNFSFGSKAMVSELDHLSHLTKLHICIKNARILPKAMVFERLESYRIAIGSDWSLGATSETSRILKLTISFQSDCGYKVLLTNCETLVLNEMKGVTNILYELDSEGFQGLKHLTVKHNNEIQYIIKSMGVFHSVFPNLESITLWYLENLERISYTQLPTESFCNLRVVEVYKCCKLEFVFSSSMVGCFSHLQEMKIEDCKIMSVIVAIEREEEIEVNSDNSIMFANLHSLKLRNLFKLKGFHSVVDSLVLFNGEVVFPNLEELKLEGMDRMKMIWPNQLVSDSFTKLRTIEIWGCSCLKSIFPTFVAKALMQLEKLHITKCATVEEIVAKEEGIETTTLFVFPKLTSLMLESLPELKSFYSGKHISEWPWLSYLQICNCDKLKIFGSNKSSVQETNGLAHQANLIQQPLFFIEEDKLPNLEILALDDGDAMNETCGEPSAEFCCNLTYLGLYGNDAMNVEAPIARAGVSEFLRLKNIVPFSSTPFCNLRILNVCGSDVLISLLTPSTARTLVQLRQIDISRCKRMTEIVAKEGSEAEAEAEADEIAFKNLERLEFLSLLSLTAFHLGNRTIKFPSLERVSVINCPKLKIFCSGVFSTPKLRSIFMEGKVASKKEGDGDLDLKATMNKYWEAKSETCDQKFVEKTNANESGENDASEGGESEHDANDNLERDATSEVGDTK